MLNSWIRTAFFCALVVSSGLESPTAQTNDDGSFPVLRRVDGPEVQMQEAPAFDPREHPLSPQSEAVTKNTGSPNRFTRVHVGEIVSDGGSSWGVTWVDFDGDEWIDLFVVNPNAAYRNNGDGSFSKLADDIITTDPLGWGGGCSWGDFDNDGDPDAFVANWEEQNNLLYQNNGGGSFTKVEHGPAANDPGWSISPSWIDYDNDGDLDLYVANHDTEPRTGVGLNFLYENHGGSFVKITDSPIVSESNHSNHASWADYDNDRDQDVLVVNAWGDGRSNALFRNEGAGHFTHLTNSDVSADDSDSWGASWGDYDNDADLDLFVTADSRCFVYENDGDGHLVQVEKPPLTDEADGSSASAWGDYDNDGDLDLFVAVGGWRSGEQNLLFENDGNGNFSRVVDGNITTDLNASNGAAWGDYDRDGDLDLFVTNQLNENEDNALYRNNGTTRSWINIKLVGTISNTSAIGAQVRATADIGGRSVTQLREVSSQTGKNGQNSLRVHFGLADAFRVETLEIRWPSGLTENLSNLAANQHITITEANGGHTSSARRASGRCCP